MHFIPLLADRLGRLFRRAHGPLLAFAIAVVVVLLLPGCTTLSSRDRRLLEQHRVSAPLYQKMLREEPLALAEIAELSYQNVPPPFINRYIDNSLATYQLTTDEVLRLRHAGVSNEVIDFMLTTPRRNASLMYDYDPLLLRTYPYYRPVIIHHHHRSKR